MLLHIIKACISSQLSQQSSSDEFAGLHLVIIKDKQTDTVHARLQMNRTHFILLRWMGAGEDQNKMCHISNACFCVCMPVYVCVCICL